MNVRQYRDLVTGLVFMGIAVAYFFLSLDIRDAGFSRVGPAFVPQIIAAVTFFLSVPLTIKGWRQARRAGTGGEGSGAGAERDGIIDRERAERRAGQWSVLISGALLVAYVIAISFLGFVLSTLVYLFLQFNAGSPVGKRNLAHQLMYLAGAAAMAILVNWAFRDGFLVLLPQGILG